MDDDEFAKMVKDQTATQLRRRLERGRRVLMELVRYGELLGDLRDDVPAAPIDPDAIQGAIESNDRNVALLEIINDQLAARVEALTNGN
jgi:hypothetical protein